MQPPTTPVPGNPLAMYETVSSPNNSSLSSLPPMSSFSNRTPQVSTGYAVNSATGAPILASSPGVEIKPELTSLYPPANQSAHDAAAAAAHQSQQQQWAMHRSAPGEGPHLHGMVSTVVALSEAPSKLPNPFMFFVRPLTLSLFFCFHLYNLFHFVPLSLCTCLPSLSLAPFLLCPRTK